MIPVRTLSKIIIWLIITIIIVLLIPTSWGEFGNVLVTIVELIFSSVLSTLFLPMPEDVRATATCSKANGNQPQIGSRQKFNENPKILNYTFIGVWHIPNLARLNQPLPTLIERLP